MISPDFGLIAPIISVNECCHYCLSKVVWKVYAYLFRGWFWRFLLGVFSSVRFSAGVCMCVALFWVILVFQGGLVETEKESERVLLHRVLLHNYPKSATCQICSYHLYLISPLFDFFFCDITHLGGARSRPPCTLPLTESLPRTPCLRAPRPAPSTPRPRRLARSFALS